MGRGQETRSKDSVAYHSWRDCQLQVKHILCSQKWHADKHVCIHATKKGARHPIEIIQQDNAGKNKKLITLVHSKDWKHEPFLRTLIVKTPQQNSYAELAYSDCGKGESGDEYGTNTQGQAFQIVGWNSEDSPSVGQSNSCDLEGRDQDLIWACWTQNP